MSSLAKQQQQALKNKKRKVEEYLRDDGSGEDNDEESQEYNCNEEQDYEFLLQDNVQEEQIAHEAIHVAKKQKVAHETLAPSQGQYNCGFSQKDAIVQALVQQQQMLPQPQAQKTAISFFTKSLLDEISQKQGDFDYCEGLVDSFQVMLETETEKQDKDRIQLYERLRVLTIPCYLKCRARIVGWLRDVCLEMKQKFETFLLCVHIMDKFMSLANKSVRVEQFQLVACSSLLIASKFTELDDNSLKVPTLCDYAADTYTSDQIRATETLILNTLDWNVNFTTSVSFLTPMLVMSKSKAKCFNEQVCALVVYFVEAAMNDLQLLEQFPLSVISSAALYAARQLVLVQGWSAQLENLTGYKETSILNCAIFFASVQNSKLNGSASMVGVEDARGS